MYLKWRAKRLKRMTTLSDLRMPVQRTAKPQLFLFLLFAILFVVIVLTCLVAAYISVRKVKTLDPVMVFRE